MIRPRRDHPPGTGPGRPAPRPGRRVLARTDGAGGTKETIEPLTRRKVFYSAGVHPARPHTADPRAPSPRPPGHPRTTPTATPGTGRTPPRPADPPDLTAWPQGMRANRAPRAAPPGRPAALRGHRGSHRPTALATNTKGGQLPGHEIRHQLRTRCAKDTRLDHVPSQGLAQNRIWRPIMAPARRPTDLLPDAGPGRRLRPRLGAQDDPPATDEHPRRHHPPRPPHRPAPQDRPPPEHLTARQPPAPPDPTGPIDTRPLHLAHHNPERRTPAPKKARPPRPNTRQTTTPTHHNPTHNTNNNPTQPANKKPRPDARFPSSLKKKRKRLSSSSSRIGGSSSHDEHVPSRREENRLRYGNRITESPAIGKTFLRSDARPGSAHIRIRDTMNRADRYIY